LTIAVSSGETAALEASRETDPWFLSRISAAFVKLPPVINWLALAKTEHLQKKERGFDLFRAK